MKCPICTGPLQEIEVTPCYDCGHEPNELEDLKNEEHEYYLFELWATEIVLCDFCDPDFGSYLPRYFGLPDNASTDYPLTLIRKIETPETVRDLYCEKCKRRLDFLKFLESARRHNKT